MSQIINLRTRRKQAARAAARRDGDARAAVHGLTKEQKTQARSLRAKADAQLDGKRRSDTPDAPQT